MNANKWDAIYLSPHLDDVVWSCGGQIAQQTRQGQRVLVLTAFAGDAPPGVQPPAWAVGSADIAARRAEDLAALEILAAQALHLDLPDSMYRQRPGTQRPLYPDRGALFGGLSRCDEPLLAELSARLQQLQPLQAAAVYAPLAVGAHADHQLCRRAAERWGAPGGRLLYYEDFPYAESEWAVQAVFFQDEALTLSPRLTWLEPVDMQQKLQAAACYRSQVALFFQTQAEMERRLNVFARTRDEESDKPAERIWERTHDAQER